MARKYIRAMHSSVIPTTSRVGLPSPRRITLLALRSFASTNLRMIPGRKRLAPMPRLSPGSQKYRKEGGATEPELVLAPQDVVQRRFDFTAGKPG
jgi:hypothetical protein